MKTPEPWQKVKDIFDDALKVEPERRESFLKSACGGNPELQEKVKELLDSFDNANSFMENPAAEAFADSLISNAGVLEKGKCFGHYEIIRQIGAGGMGEIYLAEDKKLDRRVAVKILNRRFAGHESNLSRFIQEAKSASALNHPNILVIHEIDECDNLQYIVSEFIDGRTLRDVLKEKPVKLAEVLDIAIQMTNALTAAHTAHIIHRDIKPENIIVRPDGFVKILDFGLAKLVEQKSFIGLEDKTAIQNQTAKGVILGTVNYMSPEQAKGEKVDTRTDIFSFGVVIYELISGRTPFHGDSMSETLANLINKEPLPLVRFTANVPDELQRIVTKTLRKNKDERYQTMKGLLADLRSLRENLAFDERLEKSYPPNVENATAFLQATTGDVNNQTSKANNNFTGQIKRHKLFAAFALITFLILTISFVYYFWSAGKATSDGKKSLAVLPFINISQDANAEYLSDGITESIINNLSQITSLRVMSRNSAFRFKNNQTDTKNIASQLGVESLVTGDIKQLGDKLIINVRLIDASDDSQIWGNQYIKSSNDILAAQTEIAQAVAQNLRVKLISTEQQQLAKHPTENVEAYQLYLRGRFHYFKLTEPEIHKSIRFYRQAIDIDPNYALAFAGIADAYRALSIAGWNMSSKEAFPQAKAAAQQALEIDANLAEAHIALGWIGFLYDWDWTAAEGELKRAVELAPNNADAHRAYAHLLSLLGRHEEAIAEARLSRELDPLTLITNALEGQFLFYAGRDAEAIERLQKTLELDPNFWIAHNVLARVYIRQKRYREAIAELNKAIEASAGNSTEPVTQLGYALAKSGRHEEARTTLEKLKATARERFVPAYSFAMIYNGLGEREEALNYLEKSFEGREVQLSFIKVDTRWNEFHSEPRFIKLMRRMNFE
ncbi:MAG: protein kinase domain-containing protein [Aridibacter sp.]